ncbi:MAG: hypothetical protein N2171_07850 [Clostridia bacterium]|nr:hypothetical protein [Clostridia bacterium]
MEKYGEIPKRFTKEWWDYFWYYYKWRVISIVFVVCVVSYTLVQCATNPRYDATISYAGDKYYYESITDKFCADLADTIDDIDNNGKKQILLQQITLAKDGTSRASTEYESGMRAKLLVEFQAGDTYLFLFSKQELDRLLDRESSEQIFVSLGDWVAQPDTVSDKTVKKDGVDCAVNLAGNKFMQEHYINTDDLYIAVRRVRSGDANNPKELAKYNNAIKIANYILSGSD